jgi:NAD(P)-dependent dehydrogenase (short-subunit alcohol dehydrogenase family)
MGDVELNSRRMVILGGTSGIGLATAQLAAAEGAAVVVASSNPERVDAALAALPVNAEGYAIPRMHRDLAKREGVWHRHSLALPRAHRHDRRAEV